MLLFSTCDDYNSSQFIANYVTPEVVCVNFYSTETRYILCLNEISAHVDGLCENCHTPETVEHFLLHCGNQVTVSLRNACRELNVEPSLATVLSDHRLIDVIYKNLDRGI